MVTLEDVVVLDEVTQLELAQWLETHPRSPSAGMGTIRSEFQDHPATTPPTLEGLIHVAAAALWLVRWPTGAIKWHTEAWLHDRGFPVPTRALVANL